MELVTLSLFADGVINALSIYNIWIMFFCVFLGIIGGMLPGIAPVTAIALFTPFTFSMPPSTALIALGSIFTGSTYGGSIASILINTPGTPSNVATTFDGYPMTKKGNAESALHGALLASAYGGIFGGLALLLFFEPLANLGLKFGSESYFWLAIFGLTTLASMFPGNLLKGLLGGTMGLAVSCVGMDVMDAVPRFTFGFFQLAMGFNTVVMLIALFSVCQMLMLLEDKEAYIARFKYRTGAFWQVLFHILRTPKLMVLCSSIGTFIGILPGAGGNVAAIVSYNEAKRWDKNPERFGTGELDGVLAAESSNNAAVGGSLIPLLSLGIPGSAGAAALMAGLLAQGIVPGPQMLETSGPVAFAFIASIILVCFVLIPVGYVVSRACVRILHVPKLYIIPAIFTLSFIGTYSLRSSLFDVAVMLSAGFIGYILAKARIPAAAMALGIVLGPIIEQALGTSLFRAKALDSASELLIWSPMSMGFIAANIFVLILPFILNRKKTVRAEKRHFAFKAENFLKYDFWVCAVIVIIACAMLHETQNLTGVSKVFPLWVFSIILLLGAAICLEILFGSPHGDTVSGRAVFSLDFVVYIAIVLCGYLLIPVIGFYVTMLLLMMGMLVYSHTIRNRRLGLRDIAIFCAASCIVVLIEYVFFTYLLQLRTPGGILL